MGKKWNENIKNDRDEKLRFRRGHVVVKFPLKFGLCTKKKRAKNFGGRGVYLTSIRFLKVNFLRPWNPQNIATLENPTNFAKCRCTTTGNGANPTACTQQNCVTLPFSDVRLILPMVTSWGPYPQTSPTPDWPRIGRGDIQGLA